MGHAVKIMLNVLMSIVVKMGTAEKPGGAGGKGTAEVGSA